MPNWYATRDAFKRASGIMGTEKHATIDRLLEAVSRGVEERTRRKFLPFLQTRYYRWPDRNRGGTTLWLDEDLLAVTSLQTRSQDSTPATIASSDYYVEPVNYGPPYNRIEIDLSSGAAFESGNTPQRSIAVAGQWGYTNAAKSAGTVASGLASDAAATSMVCSNAALVGVGDTLLIESEQVFVSDRSFAALTGILVNDASITAAVNDDVITVDADHGIQAGEEIRLDSEEMYVRAVSGNVLTVIRAWNGTTLAAHDNDTVVHINRTLAVERGVNGTTAVTHANGTALARYVPPADVTELVIAEAIAAYHQEQSGWGREIGTGEGAREFSGRDLRRLREDVTRAYKRLRSEAI